jgi:hypothetical protein
VFSQLLTRAGEARFCVLIVLLLVTQGLPVYGSDAMNGQVPYAVEPHAVLHRFGVSYDDHLGLVTVEVLARNGDDLPSLARWYSDSFAHFGDVRILSMGLGPAGRERVDRFDPAARVVCLRVPGQQPRPPIVFLRTTDPDALSMLRFIDGRTANSHNTNGPTPTMSLVWFFSGESWLGNTYEELAERYPVVIADWANNGVKYLSAERDLDKVLQPPGASLARLEVGKGKSPLYASVTLTFTSPALPDEVARNLISSVRCVGETRRLSSSSENEVTFVVRQSYPHAAFASVQPASAATMADLAAMAGYTPRTEIRWRLQRALADPVLTLAGLNR